MVPAWRALADTPAFFADPLRFVESRRGRHAPLAADVFPARLATWSVWVLCGFDVVADVLGSGEGCRGKGALLSFPGMALLGEPGREALATSDGEDAARLRGEVLRGLGDLASLMAVDRAHGKAMDVLLERFVATLLSLNGRPVHVYETMKGLSVDFASTVFLGSALSTASSASAAGRLTDTSAALETHTRAFWHAMTSPAPGTFSRWFSSTFDRGLEAKQALFDLFAAAPKTSLAGHLDPHHVLLFTSSIQHKSFASVLTSFTMLVGQAPPEFRERLRQEVHEMGLTSPLLGATVTEVLRLYPPLFAVLLSVNDNAAGSPTLSRVAQQGDRVLCCLVSANRDPAKFVSPNEFLPERWLSTSSPAPPQPLTFSLGPRACLGESLIRVQIMKTCCVLLREFEWRLMEPPRGGQGVKFRWLPVARPESDFEVRFSRQDADNGRRS